MSSMILQLFSLLLLLELASCDTTVSLVGGPNPHSGNVMVDGRPVCDDDWDEAAGEVVCRQLGYLGLDRVTLVSRLHKYLSIHLFV